MSLISMGISSTRTLNEPACFSAVRIESGTAPSVTVMAVLLVVATLEILKGEAYTSSRLPVRYFLPSTLTSVPSDTGAGRVI
jgi:hypothetical protein